MFDWEYLIRLKSAFFVNLESFSLRKFVGLQNIFFLLQMEIPTFKPFYFEH